MRATNKSRSRKNNRNRSNAGNAINRVFDSAGPEGRVRGTPNQVIEKYQSLARDASLAGDRVAAENFQQHAEHYIRILAEAQAEVTREQERRQAEYESRQSKRHDDQAPQNKSEDSSENADSKGDDEDVGLVETPENKRNETEDNAQDAVEKPKPRRKAVRKPKAEKDAAPNVDKLDESNAPDFLRAIPE